MEISNTVVIGIGIGTVFIGLICLILICYIMSVVVKLFEKNEKSETKEIKPAAPSQPAAPSVNKGEFAAAVASAIAEDLGTDVTGIRIKSIRRI